MLGATTRRVICITRAAWVLAAHALQATPPSAPTARTTKVVEVARTARIPFASITAIFAQAKSRNMQSGTKAAAHCMISLLRHLWPQGHPPAISPAATDRLHAGYTSLASRRRR
eukprot:COSAG05_NODE_4877_length_1338_cov_2.143664_1_plen_113_part_10